MNYYTLEIHLEKICQENKEFDLLDSVWKLNKRALTGTLSTINFNFPHFSLHEVSHSNTILSNIESFLGEERIKKLEPTDTWLLLMSAYSHDLGMVILNKTIENTLPNDVLLTFLESLSEQNRDKELKEAAELLLKIQSNPLPINKSIFELRKAIVYVIGEFFRKNHSERSKEILSGKDAAFKELLSNFYCNLIPNRFLDLLSEIAFTHGSDFTYIINNLQIESNGISRDKIHPRFIAAMLRLGDLLDVDDKRFNPISELLLDNKLPDTSELHRIKHASVKHLLIKSNLIEATVDCPNIQVYRIARQWFDWLEKEVENQNKNWSNIVPENLATFPPIIKANGIKVLFESATPDPLLMNLRFSIKPQKAIELFEGKGIYEDTSFVFLRELVQNALDANKIQLWKDITNGNYNELLFSHLKGRFPDLAPEDKQKIKNWISYPDDIPLEVYRNYQVDLIIDWANDAKKDLLFKIVDRGCGISKKDLLRMIKNVGESRNSDISFMEFKKSLPYWLKPTGAFGLGLQSVFLVADSFLVKTKADNDISYEIVFNSSKNGDYSFIKSFNLQSQRGTTVEVIVSEDNFDSAFGTSYPINLLFSFDYFSTDDSIQISKIEEYINRTLRDVDELNVYITNRGKIKSSIFSGLSKDYNKDNISFKTSDYINEIRFTCIPSPNYITNWFDIKGDLGSQIKIAIIDSFDNLYSKKYYIKYDNLFLVRDIPINDNQHGFSDLPYFGIQWNLLNPDSDKILNLSRSKLIQEEKYKHNKLFTTSILPKLINLLWEAYTDIEFQKKLIEKGYDDSRLSIILFHIFQTAKIIGINKEIPDSFTVKEFPLEAIIFKDNNRKVTYNNIIQANEFTLVKIGKEYSEKQAFDEYMKLILEEIKLAASTEIIVLYDDYFIQQSRDYSLIELKSFISKKDSTKINLLKFSNTVNKKTCVKIDDSLRSEYLKGILKTTLRMDDSVRPTIPSIEPYHDILSVSDINYQFQFNHEIYFSSFIISPFKNNSEIKKITTGCNQLILEKNKNNLKQEINSKYIDDLIPNKLSDWIIEKSLTDKMKDRKEILESYSELIAEALLIP